MNEESNRTIYRRLTGKELAMLRDAVVPAHLATIDDSGFPHITPLWFIWAEGKFWMTSLTSKPHVRRLLANPKAALCIDIEEEEGEDSDRPNRQLRCIGEAKLQVDENGFWTRKVTEKYLMGPGLERIVARRTSLPRVAISLRPLKTIAIASV